VLAETLANLGNSVIGIGRKSNDKFSFGQWVQWNPVVDEKIPSSLRRPDTVFYLAGQTSSAVARDDVAADIVSNLVGLAKVVNAATRDGNTPHVISAGATTESFLDPSGLSHYPAMDKIASFYETSKAAQRLYLGQYAREEMIDFTTLRLSNIYGGHIGNTPGRSFLDRCIQTAVEEGSVTFFSGRPYARDYLHVSDAALAFVAAAEKRNITRNRVYEVGFGLSHSILSVLQKLRNIVRCQLGIDFRLIETTPPAHTHALDLIDRHVDASIFRSHTRWFPAVDLESGITAAVARAARNYRAEL